MDFFREEIGIIGAGRVGCTLGRLFKEENFRLAGFYSKSTASREYAAALTHTLSFDTLEEIVARCDILFITCPDGEIESVWKQIKTEEISGKIFFHCSGLLSSDIFKGRQSKGAYGYCLHPFFAVNSRESSYKKIKDALFTIEGDRELLREVKELFSGMGIDIVAIKKEDKVKYHASAVFASNLVCGLYKEAVDLLRECGFTESISQKAINTIFLDNAVNITEKGIAGALTGPVERNDRETVELHLESLQGRRKTIYRELSKTLVNIAENKNPQREYSEMKELLEDDR